MWKISLRGSFHVKPLGRLPLFGAFFTRGQARLFLVRDALLQLPIRGAAERQPSPGLFTWRPRAKANASAGTFSVITEPAATYAPSPTRTGATSAELLPMKTRLPMAVGFLCTPS